MKKIRFGIIGCGLMGREFASASSRWCHLLENIPQPELVAVCSKNLTSTQWFTDHFPSIGLVTDDYRELLRDPQVQAVYCDIICAGKHLLGGKPFGIDQEANTGFCRRSGNTRGFWCAAQVNSLTTLPANS